MRIHVWFIISLLSVAACQTEVQSPPAPPSHPEVKSDNSTSITAVPAPGESTASRNLRETGMLLPNLIIQVEGNVFVRHEGQSSDQRIPVGVGSRVETGDLLYVSGRKTAVFCGDESLWEDNPHQLIPDSGPVGIPCLTSAMPPPAPDISRLRGEIDASPDEIAPYVLRPRGGWVSEERPLLRWYTPPGVETVTLTLLSDDGIARPPITVSGSETTYPAEWEPLQAGGAGYRLQISKGITSTGFSLLEAKIIDQLHQQIESIQNQIDTEPGQTLVLAELFLSYGLWSEAVDLLLNLPSGLGETTVQAQLGQTYLFMGLFDEAQIALSQSLLSAQHNNLPEATANSLYLLGWATCGLGLVNETQSHWEAALEQYETLRIKKTLDIPVEISNARHICSLPPQ